MSLHDLDDDGLPEIIARNGEVYSGKDGHKISAGGGGIVLNSDPVVGDVDHDGKIELVANKVYRWNGTGWTEAYPGVGTTTYADSPQFFAYADFGTPGGGGFDRTKLDGIAEIVSVGGSTVSIHTLAGLEIMHVTLAGGGAEGQRGGPPTIGDFDGDGFPEVATALATEFGVFDLECESAATPGCKDKWTRWLQASQDDSSARTGSTIFDFEGDGKAEAIYADECFLRIYEGGTGNILFSAFRSSCTWWEQPIVGDPDKDGRTEIIVNSNPNCYVQCPTGKSGPYLDPIHPGVRCRDNGDCVSNVCTEGFCRCTNDVECGNNFKDDPVHPRNKGGLVCAAPLAGTAGTGNVCRMQHPNPDGAQREEDLNGIKVYRDSHDRWASSRPLWNQHAYNITNINDDGTVPEDVAVEAKLPAEGAQQLPAERAGHRQRQRARRHHRRDGQDQRLSAGQRSDRAARQCLQPRAARRRRRHAGHLLPRQRDRQRDPLPDANQGTGPGGRMLAHPMQRGHGGPQWLEHHHGRQRRRLRSSRHRRVSLREQYELGRHRCLRDREVALRSRMSRRRAWSGAGTRSR